MNYQKNNTIVGWELTVLMVAVNVIDVPINPIKKEFHKTIKNLKKGSPCDNLSQFTISIQQIIDINHSK